MKFLALGFALAAAPAQAASEAAAPLQLQPKAALAAPKAEHGNAPFVIPAAGPSLDLSASQPHVQERTRSSCAESALCYDAASGRLVYKPARQFMPDIPGLRPENISVKRDRIVFRYSF